MSLLGNAIDGVIGAVFTGSITAAIFYWQNRTRAARLDDAWRGQAEELDTRLTHQYEARIAYLERALDQCQAEILWLQTILGRTTPGGDHQ